MRSGFENGTLELAISMNPVFENGTSVYTILNEF